MEQSGEENSRTRNFPGRESVEGDEQLEARISRGRGTVQGEDQSRKGEGTVVGKEQSSGGRNSGGGGVKEGKEQWGPKEQSSGERNRRREERQKNKEKSRKAGMSLIKIENTGICKSGKTQKGEDWKENLKKLTAGIDYQKLKANNNQRRQKH